MRRAPGVAGLALVLPVAALLAFGAGGAEDSVLVLGPIVVYGLPLVVMIAFWWEDWPGTRLGPNWAGWVDTALVAAGAVVLTGLGQIVVDRLDLRAMFDPSPGAGHVPTFPSTVPLAAAAFVALLQLTLVGEGWPLRGLPPLVAGPLAVAAGWAVALVIHLLGVDAATALLVITAWQTFFYVTWGGWPFTLIQRRAVRLPCAHLCIIAGGLASYGVLHGLLGVGREPLAAGAGCLVAAALVVGMLLESGLGRTARLTASVALTAGLGLGLAAVADRLPLTRVAPADWITHASLNALATAIILHVGIGRRWPFGERAAS